MLCKNKIVTMDEIKDCIFKESKLFSLYYRQTETEFQIDVVLDKTDQLVCWYYLTDYTFEEKQEIIDYINTLKFEQYR